MASRLLAISSQSRGRIVSPVSILFFSLRGWRSLARLPPALLWPAGRPAKFEVITEARPSPFSHKLCLGGHVRSTPKCGNPQRSSQCPVCAAISRRLASEQGIRIYENFPHARSVAHQMSLLPPTMMTPNTIHSQIPTETAPEPRTSTGAIIAR